MFEEELKTYKIFISYIDKDNEEYDTFIQKLSSAHDFEYENSGILGNLSDDELKKQIGSAGVVIILSGLYNDYKSIVGKQIGIARDLGKSIIVIRPYGVENVPLSLEEIAQDIIGWNAPCIVGSIEENYQE